MINWLIKRILDIVWLSLFVCRIEKQDIWNRAARLLYLFTEIGKFAYQHDLFPLQELKQDWQNVRPKEFGSLPRFLFSVMSIPQMQQIKSSVLGWGFGFPFLCFDLANVLEQDLQ